MIRVKLTAQLKDWTGGVSDIDIESVENIRGALRSLNKAFPGVGQRIMDDQEKIRAHVNIFVNGENSKFLQKDETRLHDGDVVVILPSVAGG